MSCTKTGCHVLIDPYGEYAHGDAFELGDIAYFRIVRRSRKPMKDVIHYTIRDYDAWFDKNGDVSTLITDDWISHGYDGVKL